MSPASTDYNEITGTPTVASRVVSLDIFRGITMAVMVFVNDLASVHGLPQWTYHMPAQVDAMTYVDVVFPAFLFIVGMALPIAIRQRLRRDPSIVSLWLHIALRSAALVIIGLILANVENCDPKRMHISPDTWALLGLAGAILLWNAYAGLGSKVVLLLRGTGALLIVLAFAIFRRSTPSGEAWLKFSYPEILGLIGLTYFAACLLFIPTRRWRLAPLLWFAALVLFNALNAPHWLRMEHVSLYIWPFGNGAMPSIVMAGVITSSIFIEDRWSRNSLRRIALGLMMAAVCLAIGWMLRPLGISKIRATPTWALWSIAASCGLFTLLYWISDVHHHTRWAWLVRPAGSNTLLTYLLPDVYYFAAPLAGVGYLLGHWNVGWPGVIRAIAFTVVVLLVSAALTRSRVRLQL